MCIFKISDVKKILMISPANNATTVTYERLTNHMMVKGVTLVALRINVKLCHGYQTILILGTASFDNNLLIAIKIIITNMTII